MTVLRYIQEGCQLDYTPGSALVAGTPVRLSDGRAGVVVVDTAANKLGAVRVEGVFEGPANSSDTWSKGAPLFWDESADKIIAKSLALDGAADFYLGLAAAAKTSGQLVARVELNKASPGMSPVMQSVAFEFDCETGVDTAEHVLIPAEHNPNGLLLLGAYGIITEAMAGSSQDQGIVTIEDEDDNALCTLTPSDSAADAINDVVIGTSDVFTASTGDAAKVVAAGKAVQGFVSQVTAGGTPAGKMKVYLLFMPLK